ncbi:MAG: carboxypeptidase regulatory-like domain-containing protein [Gemmatimonadetes bacterium]|nr:carboxypeptidase regulatory-like domain-containing protein [Gemmatimonadota bacterium]
MRTTSQVLALALLPIGSLTAQSFQGIVVVGAGKSAAQQAKVVLLGKRDRIVDSATTDAFGGFSVRADKAGKYTLLVRRQGFLPVNTESFELPANEVLTDTVHLTGRSAELGVRDALEQSMRRVFGGTVLAGFTRMVGPDSISVLRSRFTTLGDYARAGRMLGVSMPSGVNSSCLRFSGESYCGQLFIDELPVNLRPDQVFMSDVEAVIAIRGMELGQVVMDTRRFDASRFGVVMVYTNRFHLR